MSSDYSRQLETIKQEINSFESDLSKPEIYNDKDKVKSKSKELDKLKQKEKILINLIDLEKQSKDLDTIDKSDETMNDLILEEKENLKTKINNFIARLEEIDNPQMTSVYNNIIFEIRAGTGGEESALFVYDLFRMYSKFAEKMNWKINLISESKSEKGGLKEIIFEIEGDNAYYFLKHENGVHRVQRVPETESSGRIHTSAVSVVVYPYLESEEVDIDPSEIKIDVYRSSGAGGQGVNKTDSAVRIHHLETGIIVTCQDERSQHKNKLKALSILKSKLVDMEEQKKEAEISKTRKDSIKSGDRSAKVRTYNFPQNRLTDHRIKKSWHNLKQIMNGDIEEVFEAFEKIK